MRIKSGFVLEEVGGTYLAVAVGDRAEELRVLIKLNSTGAFLWNLASGDVTEDHLVEEMMTNYGIDRSIAQRDVTAFVAKLREGGLLDE